MARILITGSSDGLGSFAAKKLVERGHQVVLHGRNEQRAEDASNACPGAKSAVVGNLTSLEETKKLADDINKLGTFDCIIHNAALYRGPFRKTSEGIPALVAVNTIAPYVLASLITRPKRMVFVSSGMHYSGSGNLDDVLYAKRGERGYHESSAYSDSKLHNVIFAKAFARRWPDVRVSSLDPGWVATKMGGSMATGSAEKAVETYVMLAEGEEKGVNGSYYVPGGKEDKSNATANDEKKQDRLLEVCAEFSGVNLE